MSKFIKGQVVWVRGVIDRPNGDYAWVELPDSEETVYGFHNKDIRTDGESDSIANIVQREFLELSERESKAHKAIADDLLAACKAMVDNDLLADPSSQNNPERVTATRVSMQVRAAIAKAEGGSQ